MAVKSASDLANVLYEHNAKDFKSKAAATRAAQETLNFIKESLAAGDSVQLYGFGTFSVKERAPRKALNIRTREKIDVPAKRVVRFRAATALSKSVAGE